MDPTRFDTWTRRLVATNTRRAVIRLLAGAVLAASAGVGLDLPAAARCRRKTCAPCGRCKNGRCKSRPNDTPCGDDGTGRCRGGVCRPRPTCTGAGSACNTPACEQCCSGRCASPGANACLASIAGSPCLTDGDCLSGVCSGYICVGPFGHPGDSCADSFECVYACGPEEACLAAPVNQACQIDRDCRSGRCAVAPSTACLGRQCLAELGEFCLVDGDCATGSCDASGGGVPICV
jgi:hypothetical protein